MTRRILAGTAAAGSLVATMLLAASLTYGQRESNEASDLTMGGVKPAPNDTLLVAYSDDPDTLNVIIANDTVSEAFHRRVYEYLAIPRFDSPDEWEPQLAESWTYDEEKNEFTIELRRGVMWHPIKLPNGKTLEPREMTSRDVKFTFDCILNPNIEAAHIRSYFEDPDATDESERYKIKVKAANKYTVKVQWTKPYFLAETYTLFSRQIIPRHVYSVDENGEPLSFDVGSKEFADGFNNHWANTKMCGTGPMMFESWERESHLAVVRNPNYWGSPAYFSRIEAVCELNPNTMAEKGLQGTLDWAGIAQKDKYVQSKSHENVESGKVHLHEYSYPGYRYIGYNLKRPFLADKRVRQALAHATPVQTIIDQVFQGLAEQVAGPFLLGSTAYDESVEPYAFDLDAARSLLDQAGWTDSNQDGVRDKVVDGARVKASFDLMIYSDAPAYQTIATIVQENCRQIGVDVQVSPAKWPLMLQKLRKKEFDAAMLGWAMDWKQDPFQIFHGSQADVPESSNSGGYQNPEVDKLIDELRVTMDEEKQIELYHQIHRTIYEDQPYTFLFSEKATAVSNGRLENIHFYKLRPGIDQREWYSTTPRQLGQ